MHLHIPQNTKLMLNKLSENIALYRFIIRHENMWKCKKEEVCVLWPFFFVHIRGKSEPKVWKQTLEKKGLDKYGKYVYLFSSRFLYISIFFLYKDIHRHRKVVIRFRPFLYERSLTLKSLFVQNLILIFLFVLYLCIVKLKNLNKFNVVLYVCEIGGVVANFYHVMCLRCYFYHFSYWVISFHL